MLIAYCIIDNDDSNVSLSAEIVVEPGNLFLLPGPFGKYVSQLCNILRFVTIPNVSSSKSNGTFFAKLAIFKGHVDV